MKVFLRKNIERVGIQGEIIKVSDGYARNFLLPRGLAIEINGDNQNFYKNKVKQVEHRKEVIASKTSMLAERIKNTHLKIKRKLHDDGKLYAALNPSEIVDCLSKEGINITKSQVDFGKSIKSKGNYEVTIKLTSKLKPTIQVSIVSE